MSEFKIVKCKSCAAALVELQGERINRCVQCGYDFTHKVNRKAKLESVVEQAFEQKFASKSAKSNQILINNQDPSLKTIKDTNQTISQSNPQKNSNPQLQTKPKNPASIIGTIIKWYIIVFIASKVIGEFF